MGRAGEGICDNTTTNTIYGTNGTLACQCQCRQKCQKHSERVAPPPSPPTFPSKRGKFSLVAEMAIGLPMPEPPATKVRWLSLVKSTEGTPLPVSRFSRLQWNRPGVLTPVDQTPDANQVANAPNARSERTLALFTHKLICNLSGGSSSSKNGRKIATATDGTDSIAAKRISLANGSVYAGGGGG